MAKKVCPAIVPTSVCPSVAFVQLTQYIYLEPPTRSPESREQQQQQHQRQHHQHQQEQQQQQQQPLSRSSSYRTPRPVTQEKAAAGDTGTRYSLAQRVQALSLLAIGWTPRQVEYHIRVPAKEARRILKKATDRGYRPQEDLRILAHYVEDGRRTGRPRNGEAEAEAKAKTG